MSQTNQISVKTNVTAPTEIVIPLVRADHAAVSSVFRTCFEVCLSVWSCLLGYVLGLPTPTMFHFASLVMTGVGVLAFLILSHSYKSQSKVN